MFEQWQLMEKFYYDELGLLVAVFIIFGILSVSTVSHLSHLLPKIVNGLFLLFMLTSGVFIYQNYQVHSELMAKAKYVNPANRDFQRNFYRNQIYTNYEKELYRNDYMGDYFEAIGLYDAHSNSQEVEFLGRDSFNYFYFKVDDTVYLTIAKWVTFSDQATHASRVGMTYQLSDSRLTELGFVSKSRTFFQSFIVPNTLEDLEYPGVVNETVHPHRDIVAKWVAPR